MNVKIQMLPKLFEDSQYGTSRFAFLDGYRGMCALVVTLHHLMPNYSRGNGDFDFFVMAGLYIGVYGFFVLSAFLLTYKMINDFSNSNNIIDIFTIIIKYLIRRFFRIYIPYMIYVTCVKFGPYCVRGIYGPHFNTWLNSLLLQPANGSHLWTIPIEIKYYFSIPIVCLIYHYSKKYWFCILLVSLFTEYVLYKTWLTVQPKDINLYHSNKLTPRFPIFYAGSTVAILYFKVENLNLMKHIKYKSGYFKFIFSFLCFGLSIYRIKNYSPHFNKELDQLNDSFPAGVTCSILIFFMLIGEPNSYTKLLSNNYFLEIFGKYSFGVYLWHPMCILIIKAYDFNKRLEAVAIVLISSLFCGVVFYYLIENLSMKLGNYFINKIDSENIFIFFKVIFRFWKIIINKGYLGKLLR